MTTTALITGITGQDGSYLAERLVREGLDVHGIFLPSRTKTEHALSSEVFAHYADIRDTESINRIFRKVSPDEVYNLATPGAVAASWENSLLSGQVTGLGALTVMEAALAVQNTTGKTVSVLQPSSAEMFGRPKVSPQDENTAVAPVSPYGAAKAYAHFMARSMREVGLKVSTVIMYNHESPRRPIDYVSRKIAMAAARIGRDGAGVVELGNLDAQRDWGWAPDYVDAMIRALRFPVPDVYIVATGVAHSVKDFVAAAFSRVGITDWENYVVINPEFVRPVDPTNFVGNAIKAKEILGWRPTLDFNGLVDKMVEFELNAL